MNKIENMDIEGDVDLEEAVKTLGTCLNEALVLAQKYSPAKEFNDLRDAMSVQGVHFGDQVVYDTIPGTIN